MSAHLLAVTQTAHWLECSDWVAPILNAPLNIVNGHAVTPDKPRIGFSWNQEAIARYRVL